MVEGNNEYNLSNLWHGSHENYVCIGKKLDVVFQSSFKTENLKIYLR